MRRDDAYLLDILASARLAMSYVRDSSRSEFLTDLQCQDAVVRRLEILGEAARRISDETRAEHPDLPWRQMIGQRNVLAHEYDDVDLVLVWETVHRDLPRLVAYLEKLETSWRAGPRSSAPDSHP